MDKQELRALLGKYISGDYTRADLDRLLQHFQVRKDAVALDQIIDEYLNKDSAQQSSHPRLDKIVSSADRHIQTVIPVSAPLKVLPKRKSYKWLYAAAAAISVVVLGVWFFKGEIASFPRNDEVVIQNVSPGGNRATLTLADGKTIKLSDVTNGELAKEAGITIKKTADGQIIYEIASSSASSRNDGAEVRTNTIETPHGGQYTVVLPDGSKVWLNAASVMTYATSLNARGERRVDLRGEAYFQVAKDKAHPFIVKTGNQEIKVLGTEFNVTSYANEPAIKTTLLEGSVRIAGGTMQSPVVLKPGQQAENSGGRLKVISVDTREAVAWKSGEFIFNGEDIYSIMRKLSRWYGVEVEYQGDFKGKTFDAYLSRKDDLQTILAKISYSQAVHFKINERRVTVMP